MSAARAVRAIGFALLAGLSLREFNTGKRIKSSPVRTDTTKKNALAFLIAADSHDAVIAGDLYFVFIW